MITTRFPSGYGSIIKLTGKRRKPYAVRITVGTSWDPERERLTQKFKYLEYFEKRADAVLYLANYNSGMRVREHQSLQDAVTVAEVYERWIAEREGSKKGLSDSLRSSYRAAFKKFAPIHKKRIRNVRLADVQPIFDAHRDMSESTVRNMKIVIRGIYKYAMRYELVEQDFTDYLIVEGEDRKEIHHPFTKTQIRTLWKHQSDPVAQYALVTIYTGMRPAEMTLLAPEDVHLSDRYIVQGVKTDAGRDRVIPIHRDIIPILSARMGGKRIFPEAQSEDHFRENVYKPYMEELGMPHLPHDGRHTCATLMEKMKVPQNRRKLILGHKIKDITDGVYVHVEPSELVSEIDKICIL